MGRVREFLEEHQTVVVIAAVLLLTFSAWRVAGGLGLAGPHTGPASSAPRAASSAPGAAGQPSKAPSQGGSPPSAASSSAAAPSTPGPKAPETGATPGFVPPPPNTGRPDPFVPLTPGAGASGGSPAAGASLPPVPPLAPGAGGGSVPEAPGTPPGTTGPGAQLRLTGIVNGPVALAILRDPKNSYIVKPGDMVVSGVRLVSIDAADGSITLVGDNQSWQLRLGGGTTQ